MSAAVTSADLADLIERGGFVRAVLHCRQQEFPLQPQVEVLSLPILLSSGDNAWGFTRSAHGPLSKSATGGRPYPCIYGYSPHFGLVVNATPLAGIARAYALDSYAATRFVEVDPGVALWSSDRPDDTAPLRRAVEAGQGLRVGLTDADDVRYALNVHLAEVHSATEVVLYTDFDAVPAFVLNAGFLGNFARELGTSASMSRPQRADFLSVYFRLRLGGAAERWDGAAQSFAPPQRFRRLVVVGRH